MKRLSNSLRLVSALLVITLLAACAPGEPAPSPEEIEAAINTAVAQTIEAEQQIADSVAMTVAARETEAAAALPTATVPPTALPPTALPTLTLVLPTATSFVTSPSSGGSGGGGGGTGVYEYSCDPDIRKRPIDNTEFKPNDPFDVKFSIKNTGTKTWEKGIDLVILESHGVITFTTIELPADLAPGELWEIGPYDAVAPADSGHYVIDFQLKLPYGSCYPYVAFNVR
jgi:hypothetical protein